MIRTRRFCPIPAASLLLALGLSFAPSAHALEMSGTITACHDPSRIIEQNGTYTVYSTGGLINVRTSTDLVTWSWASGVFSAIPSWMTSIASNVGDTLDNIWAPDAINVGGRYLNYYSRDIGAGTSEHAVCGVATASSAAGPWTDQGAVLDVVVSTTFYRVIDPAPIVDQSGQLWIAVGSFGYASGDGYDNGGIRLFKTNSSTGKLVTAGDQGTNIAGPWIEAPFIYYHGGYYYLFFNEGRCCNGLNSNYYVRIGRSSTINGAYTDLNGNSLRIPTSGGTLFMGLDFPSNYNGTAEASPTAKANKGDIGRELGPGHIGISALSDGIERVTYHFYDTATSNGEPTMGLKTMVWGVNGWPRPGWSLPDGTYAFGTRLNADAGASTALYLDAASGTPALAAFTNAPTQRWTVTRVAANRHTIASSSGSNLAAGTAVTLASAAASSATQRWFIEQTNDMSFRVLNDGSKTSALQVPATGSTVGTAAALGSYGTNQSNQRWFITPVGGYRICCKYGNLCLQPSSSASGATVVQQSSATNTLQYWSFLPTTDGYTRIVNASTGLSMAVQGSATSDGTAVVQETSSGATNQQFSVDVLTDGSMRLVPRVSGKALEVADASTTAGAAIEQNGWLHTLNQQFTITAVALAAGGTSGVGGATGSGGMGAGGNASGGNSTGGSAMGGRGGTAAGGTLAGGATVGGRTSGGNSAGGALLGGASSGGVATNGGGAGGSAISSNAGGNGGASVAMGGNAVGNSGASAVVGGSTSVGGRTGTAIAAGGVSTDGLAGATAILPAGVGGEESGCSCRTAASSRVSSTLLVGVFLGLGVLLRRRERRSVP